MTRIRAEASNGRQAGRSVISRPKRESGPAEQAAHDLNSGRNRSSARYGRSSAARVRSSLGESSDSKAPGTEGSWASMAGDLSGPLTKIRSGGKPASTAVTTSPAEATSAPSPQLAKKLHRPSDALA